MCDVFSKKDAGILKGNPMVFDDKLYIARKIKLARHQAKLTQEELAEKIGITSKQLSRIEVATYSPSLPTFLKIVSILDIDLKEFGIDTTNKNSPLRDEINKIIYNSNENELALYLRVLKSLSDNLYLIK